MAEQFDAILVGAGQAAPSLARRLAAAGMKIAFVERHKFGGTCVNTGCTPTKTLVASARAAYTAKRAGDFGIHVSGAIATDMRQVKARKESVVRPSADGVEQGLRTLQGCTVFSGTARFTGPHSMRAGDVELEAPRIFLNVGTRTTVPPIAGLKDVPFLTNSSILELETLPEHLVIIGGSYVGLEFGQIFRRFGSQVTILQRGPRLVTREDEDVATAITAILEGEGIRIYTDVEPSAVEQQDGRITVRWASGSVSGSHLLIAAGREPNTDDLGLDQAGIQMARGGYIPVDDHLVAAPGIWALGDCNGRGAFTHTSYNDFEIVAANLLDREDRKVSDRILAYNVYIDPPLGRCGMTEAEVRKSGRPALMGLRPMTRVSRAIEKGETQGFLKVLVDAETKLILGAALLGVDCDEVVHVLLDLMYARKPYTMLTHAVQIHPTVAELLPTVLEDLRPL